MSLPSKICLEIRIVVAFLVEVNSRTKEIPITIFKVEGTWDECHTPVSSTRFYKMGLCLQQSRIKIMKM